MSKQERKNCQVSDTCTKYWNLKKDKCRTLGIFFPFRSDTCLFFWISIFCTSIGHLAISVSRFRPWLFFLGVHLLYKVYCSVFKKILVCFLGFNFLLQVSDTWNLFSIPLGVFKEDPLGIYFFHIAIFWAVVVRFLKFENLHDPLFMAVLNM